MSLEALKGNFQKIPLTSRNMRFASRQDLEFVFNRSTFGKRIGKCVSLAHLITAAAFE